MNDAERTELEAAVAGAWPAGLWQSVRVLVAVSGGADSVALLRALVRLSTPTHHTAPPAGCAPTGELIVAHFNHRLRGAASDSDAQFVAELAHSFGLRCVVGDSSAYPLGSAAEGVEAAARLARYRFLQTTAEQLGARYVVTAHTADDQAETVLHHVLRGSGLAGVAGIPAVRPLGQAVTLLRPLLKVWRPQVRAYLQALDQPYCDDATNADRAYLRNRIRHELLPLIEREYNPTARESLVRLAGLAGAAHQTVRAEAERILDEALVSLCKQSAELDGQVLSRHEPYLVCEVFIALWHRQQWPRQAMTLEKWQALAALAQDDVSPALVLPGAIRAHREHQRVVLTQLG